MPVDFDQYGIMCWRVLIEAEQASSEMRTVCADILRSYEQQPSRSPSAAD